MLSSSTLERLSAEYARGYRDGYVNRPRAAVETGLENLGDDPIGGTLRPFGQVDYDNGYEAGDNDAHWARIGYREACPSTCERCRRPNAIREARQ